ncbi:DUF1349 domain-containing protein [Streptomyces sp. NPDC088732]|uniref:DUF1349 domain-containing protein n=1 Tax=Streptomyces sp. NPDC088732 TaxID=3365879 RepID=UPI00380811DE
MNDHRAIGWDEAVWLNPPLEARSDAEGLLVTTRDRSDFWRTTSYGFVRDDGHALLAPFPRDPGTGTGPGPGPGSGAVEVTFVADFDTLYDQAGLMIRVDAATWIKAGVEMSDGVPHLGAVVTHGRSDWSLAPVPEWKGREVTVRASRDGDAVTIRARCDAEPWRMVRLAPLAPEAEASAGPFCCSPERAGLRVRFTRFVQGPADASLHADAES